MRRDPDGLVTGVFDILVVGGGIYGACIARDAALRGLSVALVERGDFGAATSFNSLKIIHGGFRYLQSMDLARLRESVRERRYWLWAAPHLVRPLRFVIPATGSGSRGPAAFRAALALYRVLAVGGGRGLEHEQAVSPGRLLTRRQCLDAIPGVVDTGIRGGVAWTDAQVVDTEALLLDCLRDAVGAGAVVVNYVEAVRLSESADRVSGVACRDVLHAGELDVRARVTVDASGPFRFSQRAHFMPSRGAGLVKSMNVVLAGRETDHAFGAAIPSSGRMVFATPWRDCTIVGTSHAPYQGDANDCRFSGGDTGRLLEDARAALPGLDVHEGRVLWRQGGLLPAQPGGRGGARAVPASRGELIDHARADGRHGLVSVHGEKYTTARSLAERAVDLCLRKLGVPPRPCTAAERRLPGAASGLRAVDDEPACEPVPNRDRYLRGVRDEMAVTLEDLLFRRCDTAVRGLMGAADFEGAADVMACELKWTPARRLREVAAARRFAARHGLVLPRPDAPMQRPVEPAGPTVPQGRAV